MEKETPPLHSRDDLQDATAASVVSSEQRPRPHLCIDILADHLPTPTPTPTQAGMSITPPSIRRGQQTSSNIPSTPVSSSSSRSRPPLRSPSFMLRQTVKSLLPAGSFKSSAVVRGYEASFSKLFSSATKTKVMARTSSLPLDDALSSSQPQPPIQPKPGAAVHHICRSQSLPMNMKKLNANAKSFKRMDSLGGMYRVVSSTPRAPVVDPDIVPSDSGTTGGGGHDDDGGEDIPEEEAVCRICMVELSEGSDTLIKLECSCKGELALAHRDCAVKWFSIKGTRTCEVCKQDVQNLPVTLLRVQSVQQRDLMNRGGGSTARYDRYRVWHGTPILVIISILAYFCFVEELLVAHDGIAALAISLPFSCILGLFSSLTTTSMVARRYVWIYAAVQFLLVVFFTHLFYRYLHLQAVISIILATFAGFGVGMTGNSIVIEILRWRARRVAPPTQQARRHRRARAPQQLQAPPASDSDQPSSQPSSADVGMGVGQHNAVAAAGDVENPPVPQA
ncbi:unnamed protein product [Miscanthus lutarioriparius]|uniref:RING-CH-type domain-containing protein n=1 Tax=Miscanthus lutarioriparius TaxID=422564 RepID=A0A811R2A8_9POAL|nr:unnamed protein product [Miscanthus lutarioriparius]